MMLGFVRGIRSYHREHLIADEVYYWCAQEKPLPMLWTVMGWFAKQYIEPVKNARL